MLVGRVRGARRSTTPSATRSRRPAGRAWSGTSPRSTRRKIARTLAAQTDLGRSSTCREAGKRPRLRPGARDRAAGRRGAGCRGGGRRDPTGPGRRPHRRRELRRRRRVALAAVRTPGDHRTRPLRRVRPRPARARRRGRPGRAADAAAAAPRRPRRRRPPERRPRFTAEDEELLEAFAASAATAVATAQPIDAARRRERLAASEAERRALGQRTPRRDPAGPRSPAPHPCRDRRRRAGAAQGPIEQADRDIEAETENLPALITDLRPAALDQSGIEAAIETLADRAEAPSPRIQLRIDLSFEAGRNPSRLDSELETASTGSSRRRSTTPHAMPKPPVSWSRWSRMTTAKSCGSRSATTARASIPAPRAPVSGCTGCGNGSSSSAARSSSAPRRRRGSDRGRDAVTPGPGRPLRSGLSRPVRAPAAPG